MRYTKQGVCDLYDVREYVYIVLCRVMELGGQLEFSGGFWWISLAGQQEGSAGGAFSGSVS